MQENSIISIACMYRDDTILYNMIDGYRIKLSILYYIFYPLFKFIFWIFVREGKKHNYTHCEICFPDNDSRLYGTVTAFGVNVKEGVFKKTRSFGNKNYMWIHLVITQEERDNIYEFCESSVSKTSGITYDTVGLYRGLFAPTKELDKLKAWCTAWIIKALQRGHIIQFYRETSQDSDDIVKYLKNHPSRVEGLPPNLLTHDSAIQLVTKEFGFASLTISSSESHF